MEFAQLSWGVMGNKINSTHFVQTSIPKISGSVYAAVAV